MLSAYFSYIFGKFACKIVIQTFSYAIPVCLTVPALVAGLVSMSELRNTDPCYYHGIIPDYLFFNSPALYSFSEYITQQHAWVWILWLISQVWVTWHIWTPQSERLVPTEKLYVTPMYNGLLIDQSLAMNRKQDDVPPVSKKNINKPKFVTNYYFYYYCSVNISKGRKILTQKFNFVETACRKMRLKKHLLKKLLELLFVAPCGTKLKTK